MELNIPEKHVKPTLGYTKTVKEELIGEMCLANISSNSKCGMFRMNLSACTSDGQKVRFHQ